MANRSLQSALDAAASPVEMLRQAGKRWVWPREVATEYTNWMDELRAVRETCVLADLSHHQMDQVIEGPDAMAMLEDLCVNSFADFAVGQAKQAVMCNPDGYFIGDGVLQHVEEETFVLSGKVVAANWVAYHADTGDYDVAETIHPKSSETDDDPHFFTYQIQGPNALDAFEDAIEGPLPEVDFFDFAWVTIAGHEVRALRHGMAGEAGFEIQGPYEHGAEIKDVLLAAGEDYGIRRLGTRAYEPLSVTLGWITTHTPAVYTGEELRGYREWLDADGYEGSYALAGSFDSEDIEDYYVSPVDVGYTHMIAFEHDFVGRAALEADLAEPRRDRVTLVWDDEDVIEIFASLFRTERLPHLVMDLPRDRWGGHHDEVRVDGDVVGISKSFAYSYSTREMVSICTIDVEHSYPGTEVTLVWGEAEGESSTNPLVEPHTQTEVSATVAPSPYVEDAR